MWREPKSVWAVAFACVAAFMGIGLADPILKLVADSLSATPSQMSLLFTSYAAQYCLRPICFAGGFASPSSCRGSGVPGAVEESVICMFASSIRTIWAFAASDAASPTYKRFCNEWSPL